MTGTRMLKARASRGVLFAALAPVLSAVPAAADPIATRFEMYGFAGAHVLTLQSRTDESADRYGVSIHFRTKGLAAVFVNMTSNNEVSGRIVGGMAAPVSFRSDSNRNGVERRTRVDYRGGTVDATTTPPLAQPATPAQMRGT